MSPRPDMTYYPSHKVQHFSEERTENKNKIKNIEKDIKNLDLKDILKSSAVLVGNAIRKRRAQAMFMPPLETTNLNKIPKFPITSENMDTVTVTSDSDN